MKIGIITRCNRGGPQTAAFYAASELCDVKSIWIGFVSDSLVSERWDDWHINLTELAGTTSTLCFHLIRRIVEKHFSSHAT